MFIKELVHKYIEQGYSFRNAQNLAAEEIILSKIATSSLSEHVTLKGGIVMFNITKNNRRVTQDIDFDFIRYSIDVESIKLFIDKMNRIPDGISVSVIKDIEPLHQENYQGMRVNVLLTDTNNEHLKIKLDIGVHTYSAIEQERIVFIFESGDKSVSLKVNPCEQIFAEKILSLARLGVISTRYKDLYDIYFLIESDLLKLDKVREILSLFFSSSKRKPNNINELVVSIIDVLQNKSFEKEAREPTSKWLDVDYDVLKATLIRYISNI